MSWFQYLEQSIWIIKHWKENERKLFLRTRQLIFVATASGLFAKKKKKVIIIIERYMLKGE